MVTIEYSDVHRALVQTIMSMGIVELELAQVSFSRILEKYGFGGEDYELSSAVALINKNIACFDQKIVLFEFSLNGKSSYIFHNTSLTAIDKFQNIYSKAEIEYFQIPLKEIAVSKKMFCLPTEILNMTSQLKEQSLSKTEAQDLMEKWIKQGYFYKTADFKITFGAKMLVEFKSILINSFPNHIMLCFLCKHISIWGSQCDSCEVVFHKKCITKYTVRSNTCASCKEPWVEVDQH